MPSNATSTSEPKSVFLAIETSQRQGGVALRDRSGILRTEPIDSRRRRDDQLMPAIGKLFDESNLQPDDLDMIAVSIGPGGFTGLRIAITTAKMLAELTHAKLVAVPSALVAAIATNDKLEDHDHIAVALAGKRDAVWLTACRRDVSGAWAIINKPGQVHVSDFSPREFSCILADQHLPPSFTEKCSAAGVAIIDPTWSANACLAAADGILKRDGNDATIDPLQLNPLYAREPEAVTIWDQRIAKGAGD